MTIRKEAVRMKWNHQYIINSTLKGEHAFLEGGVLRLNWSAVLSKAYSETPDNAEIFFWVIMYRLLEQQSAVGNITPIRTRQDTLI